MWSSPAAFEVEAAAGAQAFAATGAEAGVSTPSDWSSRMQADPNMLSELLLGQQRMNMQLNMQLVQLLAQGLSQQNPTSAPAAPRRKSRNKAPRPQKAERERRRQAWMATTAEGAAAEFEETGNSQEAQGDVAAPPQPRSDAESWIEVDTMATKAYVDDQIRALKVARLTSEHCALQAEVKHAIAELSDVKVRLDESLATKEEPTESKELVEQLNQLHREKDELAARLADVQGSMQKSKAETADEILQLKTGRDGTFEQLSKEMSEMKHTVGSLNNAVVQLTDKQGATQAAVQDVAVEANALEERLEEMQSMALRSTVTKEEIDEQFSQFKLEKDATMERLSSVLRALDAAGRDAVSAPTMTIHGFDLFASLDFGEETRCNDIIERPITVTLLRSSDGSTLASAPAPCKFCFSCYRGFSFWVNDPQALRQCVTRLMASNGAAGQRWAYFTRSPEYVIDNLSYISASHLSVRKTLTIGNERVDRRSNCDWLRNWLTSSPVLAVTDADVTRARRGH